MKNVNREEIIKMGVRLIKEELGEDADLGLYIYFVPEVDFLGISEEELPKEGEFYLFPCLCGREICKESHEIHQDRVMKIKLDSEGKEEKENEEDDMQSHHTKREVKDALKEVVLGHLREMGVDLGAIDIEFGGIIDLTPTEKPSPEETFSEVLKKQGDNTRENTSPTLTTEMCLDFLKKNHTQEEIIKLLKDQPQKKSYIEVSSFHDDWCRGEYRLIGTDYFETEHEYKEGIYHRDVNKKGNIFAHIKHVEEIPYGRRIRIDEDRLGIIPGNLANEYLMSFLDKRIEELMREPSMKNLDRITELYRNKVNLEKGNYEMLYRK